MNINDPLVALPQHALHFRHFQILVERERVIMFIVNGICNKPHRGNSDGIRAS